MDMDPKNSSNIDKSIQFSEASIDLNISGIKKFFIRNKKLIITSIISVIIPSLGYSFIRRPTYEGVFQIVLSNKETKGTSFNKQSLLQRYEGISNFLNIGSGLSKKLETEVQILKSPLILMPSYEFYKNALKENGINVTKLRFFKWKKKLNVELVKKTSVLEISYKDKNKELIIPILNLISNDYQKYSGRDRLRSINKGIYYLEEQIIKIEEKSRKAYKKAFLFALENNLDTKIIISEKGNFMNDEILSKSFLDENKSSIPDKYEVSLKLNLVEKQLKNLENINTENYTGNLVDFKSLDKELYKELVLLDNQINSAKLKYLDSDYYLRKLNDKRKSLIKTLLSSAKNNLEVEKIRYQNILESLARPNEILIKDRELKSEANRLVNLYDQMVSKLELSKLEKAKELDLWELISNPRIKEEPVGIRNSQLPILGLIFGCLLGILIAKYKEDRKELIFEFQTLNEEISQNKLCELSINDINLWDQYVELICDKQKSSEKVKEINLIYVGSSLTYKNDLNKLFSNSYKQLSVDKKLDNQKLHILIAESGKVNKSEIIKIQQQINLINPYIIGIIFIS